MIWVLFGFKVHKIQIPQNIKKTIANATWNCMPKGAKMEPKRMPTTRQKSMPKLVLKKMMSNMKNKKDGKTK